MQKEKTRRRRETIIHKRETEERSKELGNLKKEISYVERIKKVHKELQGKLKNVKRFLKQRKHSSV